MTTNHELEKLFIDYRAIIKSDLSRMEQITRITALEGRAYDLYMVMKLSSKEAMKFVRMAQKAKEKTIKFMELDESKKDG